jgi:hypothetical protein
MSKWEDLLEEEEYEPVHKALLAGVKLLEKYYRRSDDTDVYFIAHGKSCCQTFISSTNAYGGTRLLVLDPVLKHEYLRAAWDDEYIDLGMQRFRSQVRHSNFSDGLVVNPNS